MDEQARSNPVKHAIEYIARHPLTICSANVAAGCTVLGATWLYRYFT